MPVVVSVVGLNGSGKTTAADHIFNNLKNTYKIQRLSFATPLKAIAAHVDITKEKRGKLEQFSHVLKQNLGHDIFACRLLDSIDNDADIVLIDDMRYAIEYDVLAGFYNIVTIHNMREPAIKVSSEDIATHLSDKDRLTMLLLHIAKTNAPVVSVGNCLEAIFLCGIISSTVEHLSVRCPDVAYTVEESQGMLIVKFTDAEYRVVMQAGVNLEDIDEFVKEKIAPFQRK